MRYLLAAFCLQMAACVPDDDLIPLVVSLDGRSMSKLPFVIAHDQGLYRKYGLDVEFRLPPPEFDGGKIPRAPLLLRIQRRLGLVERGREDILVTGHTPAIYLHTHLTSYPHRVALAATDCSIRYYFVAREGINSIDDIKGKRIGVNANRTTSALALYRLLEMKNWDRRFDVTILEESRGVQSLKDGHVDVIVGGDEAFEEATREGMTILLDTREWDDALAGNSMQIEAGWLEQGNNREAARRFLQALLEGLVIFHQRPQQAIDIAQEWYGFPDREYAEGRYARADYVLRVPEPCYEGVANTLRIHDSHAMRQYEAGDFYDASLLRELLNTTFLDDLYRAYPTEG